MDRGRSVHRGDIGRLRRGQRLFVGGLGLGLRHRQPGLRRCDRRVMGLLGGTFRSGTIGLGSSPRRSKRGIRAGDRLVVSIARQRHDGVERGRRDAHTRLKGALGRRHGNLECACG